MTQFCTRCGTQQSDEEAKFCSNCGNRITAGVEASTKEVIQPGREDEERVLRDTESEDFKARWTRATYTGSSKSTQYKLTNRMLYVTEGIFNTTSIQIPLWAVSDVSVVQGFEQKMSTFMRRLAQQQDENVGNVAVTINHTDYSGRDSITLHNIADPDEVRRLLNEHVGIERLAHNRRRQTHYYGHEPYH